MSAHLRGALATVGGLALIGAMVFFNLSHWAFQGEWRIARIEGVSSAASGTVRFDDDSGTSKTRSSKDVRVETRCSAYEAGYTRDLGRVRFDELQPRWELCPEDEALRSVMQASTRYRYEGRSLVLATPDGRRLVLVRPQ